MNKYLKLVLDWSEVWAPFISLSIVILHRKQPAFLKPVIVYLVIAFFLNLLGDVIADFKHGLPAWLQSNNPLYNLHSIVRFTCFTAFFLALKQPSFNQVQRVLPLLSLLFLLINFGFVENFFHKENLSGNLLSFEAYLLLVYCLLYYLSELKEDVEVLTSGADFWVATGLCIYVVINFFVFLFYVPLLKQNWRLADKIWNVHNIAYILLCIFIAKAFYVSARSYH